MTFVTDAPAKALIHDVLLADDAKGRLARSWHGVSPERPQMMLYAGDSTAPVGTPVGEVRYSPQAGTLTVEIYDPLLGGRVARIGFTCELESDVRFVTPGTFTPDQAALH